jgi:sulfur-oxidizing protein SoxB
LLARIGNKKAPTFPQNKEDITMSRLGRREFLKLLGISATASSLPLLYGCDSPEKSSEKIAAESEEDIFAGLYDLPMKGNARILHITDVHGQLNPVYFREPNVNLGIDGAYGRPPHIVGKKLLDYMELPANSLESYAYTYLDYEQSAKKYGRMGGFAQIKTLLDRLRESAGGKENTLTLDGGDLWQGSGTSLWTRGVDMVEASNILGIDVMVGHWEFTYRENEVLSNVALFNGDFIGQNVRVKDESMMDDTYAKLVEQYDGRGLYDEDTGHAFQPYVIKNTGGSRIAIIGQAFPRTGNANPPEFFPDWSFGLREDDLIALTKQIREEENPDAIVLLSHNGMDVKNIEGETCWVTNAGSNGKYVGVMDFDIQEGKIKEMHYQMLPVFEDALPGDKEMQAYIDQMRQKKYDENIIESRAKDRFFNKQRLGKTFKEILDEKLAIADRTLYRRGNFIGTWDQVLCNALREEHNADISMSPGVRWGTTTLKGEWITMEDVMTQCSLTYGETYAVTMKGERVKNILEQIADNLFDPDPYLQSGGDMVRIGGLDFTINPTGKLFERISNVTLDNGEPMELDKEYIVAGWALVDRIPEGRLMWDIVRDYIINNKDSDNVLRLKKINYPVLVGVSGNPGIADYGGKLI